MKAGRVIGSHPYLHNSSRGAATGPLLLEELIESRIGLHDSNQFEVKLDYAIGPQQRNRYRIEAYFFVPRSLGIDSYTYPRDRFYADIQAYIRFKTPSISLASLLDETDSTSLFATLSQALSTALRDGRNKAALESVSRELRLLGCLIRSNVRDRIDSLAETYLSASEHKGDLRTLLHQFESSANELLSQIDQVMNRLRCMQARFSDPVLPAWVQEAYAYVDEYLSFTIETQLTTLIRWIDRSNASRSLLCDTRQRIIDRLLSERIHRESAASPTVLNSETGPTSGGKYIYRSGLLKKFVSSVLFLEMRKEREGGKAAVVAAGGAAGIAMFIATVLSIVAQARWNVNSLSFVLAVVASYILKDRIKEWLKHYFSNKMTGFLWDYSVRIRDPQTGIVVGRCREAFSFLAGSKIPVDVFELRHRGAESVIETESKPEVVMKYEKDVRLDGSVIAQHFGRLGAINDIIRFNISDFLVRTDDPIRLVPYYDPENDRVEGVKCPKQYHLNMVFVYRANDDARSVMERVRVVFDKRGIQRVEAA